MQETMEMAVKTGSLKMCKVPPVRSPVPSTLSFHRPDAIPAIQPTVSKYHKVKFIILLQILS